MEPNKAFAERIRLHFAQDLGPDWQHWPAQQRRSLIKKFLVGLTNADYQDQRLNKNEDELQAMTWVDFANHLAGWTQSSGPKLTGSAAPPKLYARQTRRRW